MIRIRDAVVPADAHAVREIVASTGFFSPAEIAVAVELVDDRLSRGDKSDYHFVFAEWAGRVIGYACFGPIACTVGSFDIYWVAVHQEHRGGGVGRTLLAAGEARIAAAGGRRAYVETSSREQYAPTRAFYERCGYVRAAELPDFYAPGDGKVIYVKVLG
jgi:ribosomal protein S18 acetylase RimI-like enzyme